MEIRKEVSFLSALHHENLTKLCGVSTNPYMLLIELAPLGSLGAILKQYRAANTILTPVLLQASMLQVCSYIITLFGSVYTTCYVLIDCICFELFASEACGIS